MSNRLKSPITLIILILILVAIVVSLGPPERTLGTNVRLVYLHGSWVWVALLGFVGAALVGLAGLISRHDDLHRWSRALGRTGLFFWITFIPMSMVAAQFNWNGLFLVEPRWRMAFALSVSGVLLQVAVSILPQLYWNSLANIAYAAAAFTLVGGVENVMHPESPILTSNSTTIKVYFFSLLALVILAAWQVARGWLQFDRRKSQIQSAN